MGAATILVCDETQTGERSNSIMLSVASECVTARELIERRIRLEVEAHNRKGGEYYHGLVAPPEAEVAINGVRIRKHRMLDPAEECRRAMEAFALNRFFILAGDHQVEELDEQIVITPNLEVRFVKLVPLIGG